MATQEPVEVPTETLERIDAFLKDPTNSLARRERPQRQENDGQTFRVDEAEPVEGIDDSELDPIIVTLRKEREMRSWTQWDVARRMGYTAPSMISELERGMSSPTLHTLRAWGATMDVDIVARVPVRRGRPRTNFRK